MTSAGISSGGNSNNLSMGITTALASALLEWFLISFLFVDAVFSYFITKFAFYCKLQLPCLFCSRLDHVLGKEKQGYYWDLICRGHKLEISSSVLCRAHDKLVNVHGMCEACLFSFATFNKSNSETYRLLVGKLGEESEPTYDQDPLLGHHKLSLSTTRQCSCCNERWVFQGRDQRLALTKSIGSEANEFDIPASLGDVGIDYHEKRTRSKPSVSVKATHLRTRSQIDPLSHVGYTELKINSDTESEAALSDDNDDDAINMPIGETDDTKEDIKVQCVQVEPPIIDLDEDMVSEKVIGSASQQKPSMLESERGRHLESTDTHGSSKSAVATAKTEDGLEKVYWQQVERCADAPQSSNKTELPVETSKETYGLATSGKVELTSEQRCTMENEEMIKSGTKLTTSEAGSEPTPVLSDNGQQYPNLLDLGDAYKLAVSNKGRQLSGLLAEQWLGKDSSRISEDLKILLSQLSAARGIDQSVNDLSPRLSLNSDEVKTSDASNSAGMHILQKRVSLERNESGLSLDGSIVSEIEGESIVDRLKRQVDHDRKLMSALYKELEEERNASAVSANQALAMITRLQEEKATLHMEALQYLRMMDEQSEYETEALQKANNLLAEKEREIEELEAELEFFRKNLTGTNSDMKVKDIGLDHPQATCKDNDESISDKPEEENMSLEEKNIEAVKSPVLKFEDENERLYILQQLKKLEKQVYLLINIHQSPDNGINSESQENIEKLVINNQALQDSVSPMCKENGEHECDGRHNSHAFLDSEVLETDQSFLEHSINILSNGDEGLKLLREISHHLQQLRQIGIRDIDTDQPAAI